MAWYDIAGMQARGRMNADDILSKLRNRDAQSGYQEELMNGLKRKASAQPSRVDILKSKMMNDYSDELENRYDGGKMTPEQVMAALIAGKSGKIPEGLDAYATRTGNPNSPQIRMQSEDPGQLVKRSQDEKALYEEDTGKKWNDTPWWPDFLRTFFGGRPETPDFMKWRSNLRSGERPLVDMNNSVIKRAHDVLKSRRGR